LEEETKADTRAARFLLHVSNESDARTRCGCCVPGLILKPVYFLAVLRKSSGKRASVVKVTSHSQHTGPFAPDY